MKEAAFLLLYLLVLFRVVNLLQFFPLSLSPSLSFPLISFFSLFNDLVFLKTKHSGNEPLYKIWRY